MFIECDEVAVLEKVWNLIKTGDKVAIQQLKNELNEMDLYMHALSANSPPYTWVSIRDLNKKQQNIA